MKKISLIFIALSFVLLFIFYGNDEVPRYSSTGDRDTMESFGVDGQFAIYKFSDENFNKKLDLYDTKNQDAIDIISNYKEIEPYVYTIGEKGYTKLNYANGNLIQSNDLNKFSNNDKAIFEGLNK
ncbi:hypothetical protein JJB67_02405 [Clostridium perfringens]|uniref:hypothetical protein n=1 Tax=Clostridium perfringens TaxID=1502 RepID=UPI000D70E74E|nr:hypothetical protein [Clostridium perfringens]MBO3321256.1 hypothetical protein [Clostridium perfringens]MBO3330371.1 hypothetical protein [Clostridium perfringens]MDC4243029.1 hypothetical protein [Clostridium perfringens]PWX05294.1 hypothetical protein CYK73_04660 [Clostridium perfringens]PWX05903.1 hypothetical protein CYK71_01850 [Clostridium perfringens]